MRPLILKNEDLMLYFLEFMPIKHPEKEYKLKILNTQEVESVKNLIINSVKSRAYV